ncbi:hypothetical protein VTP01DRAFT_2332 [Rhizomucor pusillus]|uniref:uncharacterized protein n=1 Tax=Rhizomucor pusillus TaxID=4840 RepID=UPI0037420F43
MSLSVPHKIVCPCPKKLSAPFTSYRSEESAIHDEEAACNELRQILMQQYNTQEQQQQLIARTDNPLPHDSSFIVPLHQLQLGDTKHYRPRSYSAGDHTSRSFSYKTASIVH